MKRKVGVIGGLGTETAAQFYIESEQLWHAAGQLSHIPLMLENTQSPFSLEQSLACNMERVEELRDFLCSAAQDLQRGGSSFIVIPCNTAHVHIEQVRAFVDTPVLSITEEVAKKMASQGIKTAAILGTAVTRSSGIYDHDCQAQDITTIYPTATDQKRIEMIIQRTLAWKNDQTDTDNLMEVIEHVIGVGAEAVVLACTDLQLCLPKQLPPKVIDSMRTLSEASVNRLLR